MSTDRPRRRIINLRAEKTRPPDPPRPTGTRMYRPTAGEGPQPTTAFPVMVRRSAFQDGALGPPVLVGDGRQPAFRCPACRGNRRIGSIDGPIPCGMCHAWGYLLEIVDESRSNTRVRCPCCNGRQTMSHACPLCHDRGHVSQAELDAYRQPARPAYDPYHCRCPRCNGRPLATELRCLLCDGLGSVTIQAASTYHQERERRQRETDRREREDRETPAEPWTGWPSRRGERPVCNEDRIRADDPHGRVCRVQIFPGPRPGFACPRCLSLGWVKRTGIDVRNICPFCRGWGSLYEETNEERRDRAEETRTDERPAVLPAADGLRATDGPG